MRLVRWSSTGLAVIAMTLGFYVTQAAGAGFRLPEAGAKAMGMGFAFTAQANDPSAIYFNPAGLTQLEGQNVMVGVTYVRENGATFTGETPITLVDPLSPKSETQKDLDFFIPNAYYTMKASPNFAYGVGIFVPFGLGQEYENRDTSIFRNQITKIELMTFVVNPTAAWKVNDVLSVGAGIDFMYGKAKLAQTGVIPGTPLNIFKLDLEGDGTAWGYNAGLLLEVSKTLKAGFSYRSPFKLKIRDGDVEIRDINSTIGFVPPGGFTAAQVFGGTAFNTSASTEIDMPATAAFGLAYTGDRLTVEADADWTFWHTFRTLVIDIKQNVPPSGPVQLLPDATRPEEWNDVVAFRIGAEYRVTDPLALRLGFAYDPTPVPAETLSPLLPDADRLNYMAGVGYKFGAVTIDASYFYVDKKDRTVDNLNDADTRVNNFAGTWKGDAHVVALDIGYRF